MLTPTSRGRRDRAAPGRSRCRRGDDHGTVRRGRVRDYAALTGRVNIDRTTGEAVHQVVDSGTCHQRANLGPGADQAVVFGPFFVLPFNTTVIMG